MNGKKYRTLIDLQRESFKKGLIIAYIFAQIEYLHR